MDTGTNVIHIGEVEFSSTRGSRKKRGKQAVVPKNVGEDEAGAGHENGDDEAPGAAGGVCDDDDDDIVLSD